MVEGILMWSCIPLIHRKEDFDRWLSNLFGKKMVSVWSTRKCDSLRGWTTDQLPSIPSERTEACLKSCSSDKYSSQACNTMTEAKEATYQSGIDCQYAISREFSPKFCIGVDYASPQEEAAKPTTPASSMSRPFVKTPNSIFLSGHRSFCDRRPGSGKAEKLSLLEIWNDKSLCYSAGG